MDHVEELAVGEQVGLSDRLARETRVVLEVVGGVRDVEAGVSHRVARVPCLQLGEGLGVLADERREPVEDAAALHAREPAPAAVPERGSGGLDRPVHVPGRAGSDVREHGAGRGVLDGERAAILRGHTAPIDDVARLAQEPIDAGHDAPHPPSWIDPASDRQIVWL